MATIQYIKAKKLEWSKSSDSRLNYSERLKFKKKLGKGWRFPTLIELLQAYYDNIPGFVSDYYWSSTTYAGYTDYAWLVLFNDGYPYYGSKTFAYYVRCVRG